ncbi:MAG TPA: hypothetical protein VF246_04035 [Acidimicrobiia bacterium]
MVRERLVVVAPGPDTFRWVGRDLSIHPALVAVDRAGRPRFFGEEVLSSVAGQWGDYELVSPFSSVESSSMELTLAYMSWLVTEAPHAARRKATVLLVPTGAQFLWRRVGDRLPGETAVLLRPVTMAMGLGLDVDASSPHFLLDVRADGAEVSVVCESRVVGAQEAAGPSPEALAEAALQLFGELDPDLEYEARNGGAHAMGLAAEDAQTLAGLLGLTIRVATQPERVLARGVLADRNLIETYFRKSRSWTGRLLGGSRRPLGAG